MNKDEQNHIISLLQHGMHAANGVVTQYLSWHSMIDMIGIAVFAGGLLTMAFLFFLNKMTDDDWSGERVIFYGMVCFIMAVLLIAFIVDLVEIINYPLAYLLDAFS